MGVANRKSVAWHVEPRAGRGRRGSRLRRAERSPPRAGAAAGRRRRRVRLRRRVRGPDRPARARARRAVRRASTASSTRSPSPTTPASRSRSTRRPKRDFLRAFDISCFSLVAVSNALKDLLAPDASVVTISISTTRMASENYGYMAPDQGGARFVAGLPGQVVQPLLAGAVQRRGPRLAEDLGLGRHPRLRRFVPVRRAGHAPQTGRAAPRKWPTWPRSCSAPAPAASTPSGSSSTPA